MKAESTRYLELLERRLALLGSLARELAESRGDFIGLDLEGIHRRIGDQERLCMQIRSLDTEITLVQARCAEQTGARVQNHAITWPCSADESPGPNEPIRAALARVAAAQAEVKRLNDAHQAMLRRSHRTVNILLNFFSAYAPTYAAPPAAATLDQERV